MFHKQIAGIYTTYIDNDVLKVCYTNTNTEHYLIRTCIYSFDAAVLCPFCAKFVIAYSGIKKELKF